MATLAPCQQVGHSVRHVGYFRWLVDGNDDFKNDFLFLGMKFATKSILGPKCRDEMGIDQYFKIFLVFMFLSVYWIFLVIEVSL